MNNDLLYRIESMRTVINADSNGPLIGDIPPGIRFESSEPYLADFVAFVHVTNEARCGVYQFYPAERLADYQYGAEFLQGGVSRWLVVGNLFELQIAIDRTNGSLLVVNPADETHEPEIYDRFDSLLQCIFGGRYLATAGVAPDGWFALLQQLDLTTP